MRKGFTLLELSMATVLLGLMVLVALPALGAWRDRGAVRLATSELMAFYHAARHSALVRGTRVRVSLGEDSFEAAFEGVDDSTFLVRPGPAAHGVALVASRRVFRIHPNGLGRAGANATLVLRRGQAAESLTTSRLGRLRRW